MGSSTKHHKSDKNREQKRKRHRSRSRTISLGPEKERQDKHKHHKKHKRKERKDYDSDGEFNQITLAKLIYRTKSSCLTVEIISAPPPPKISKTLHHRTPPPPEILLHKRSSPPSSSSNAEKLSLSIEDTNKLRAKLSLKPLEVSSDKPRTKGNNKDHIYHPYITKLELFWYDVFLINLSQNLLLILFEASQEMRSEKSKSILIDF